MSSKSAGVILSAAFVLPQSNVYRDYISYMKRSQAVRNEHFHEYNAFGHSNAVNAIEGASESMFQKYHDYMANPQKTTALFNRTYEQLPIEVLDYYRGYFDEAQDNESPLWQFVFSFRNEWLSEHGFYNQESGEVDRLKLISATRQGIQAIEVKEHLKGDWTGAIHFNTDNIHVHVGYVEREPTREYSYYMDKKNPQHSGWQYRGKLKGNSLKSGKRKFVNTLLDLEKNLKKTNDMFQKIVASSKENTEEFKQEMYAEHFMQLLEVLPVNKRYWTYGYSQGKGFKKHVDNIVNIYLNSIDRKQLEQLKVNLKKISDEYESAYGNPQNKSSYFENKFIGKNGLYHQLGNVVLKTAKEMDGARKKYNSTLSVDTIPQIEYEKNEELANYMQSLLNELPPEDELYTEAEARLVFFDPFEELSKENPRRLAAQKKLEDALMKLESKKESPYKEYLKHLERESAIFERNNRDDEVDEKKQATVTKDDDYETRTKEFPAEKKTMSTDKNHRKKVKNNLEDFSKKNKKLILSQNQNATYVMGKSQWLLSGRRVKSSEIHSPLLILAPKKFEQSRTVDFITVEVYDVTQTEEYAQAKFIYSNQEGTTIKQGSSKRKRQSGINQKSGRELDRQLKKMQKGLDNTLQEWLNRRIYNELEYELGNTFDN